MDKKQKFDYEEIKKKTLERLRSGKSLFGKDGAFAPLLKTFWKPLYKGRWKAIRMKQSDLAATARTARLPRG